MHIKIAKLDESLKFLRKNFILVSLLFTALVILTVIILLLVEKNKQVTVKNTNLENQLKITSQKLKDLQNQDQYKINQELKEKIKNVEETYKTSISLYEKITDLSAQKVDTQNLEEEFAKSLNYLSNLNYSSAAAVLVTLKTEINKKEASLISVKTVALVSENVTASNSLPSGGFSTQKVKTDNGEFIVYIVSADLNSTKVIVDTASEGDCGNSCPVLSLSDYVSRNSAFAGINGSYFCPAEYPSCAGKSNSFDLLVMNKNKVYFNSANNVYSTNPAVIFSGNSARFVGQALEWGRDTGVDSVLSNYPLLVSGGNIAYSSGGDAKYNPKGTRTFVAAKGNMVFIGAVLNASMSDSAKVLKALGVDNALNLDQGGSTALWYGGYKLGPGRNIPNAILFVRK